MTTTSTTEVRKVELSPAYARNGNAHNPSRRWIWESFIAGKSIGLSATKRAALELLEEELKLRSAR